MLRTLLQLVAVLTIAVSSRADEKFVKLVLADGKVLSVAEFSDEAGAPVVVAADGDSKAQQWQVVEDGKFLKLVNRKSGKVLDVFEASKDEGTKIIVWDEKTDDTDNQRWSWDGDGKEKRLKSKSSELVLDVDDKGNVIQKKADEKAKGQVWTVKEVK
jgi:Ricin-type beta-trefoil lectin domain-like